MIINLKSQTDLSGFYIVYEGSTNLEKEGWFGLSHLMEHLQCKSFEHLREDLEREGVDWNASTSSNEVIFYFTGLEENINARKYEIFDLMSQFNITKEDFEKERNIVLQEYTDYFGEQTESHALNLGRKLFLDYDPIGKREDLENLKFMDCLNFFELQFQNPTKIINVSAKTKFDRDDIDFFQPKINKKVKFGPYPEATIEKMNDFGDKSSIIMVSPVAESDFAYITFINSMLSSGLSSPLYSEVREKRGLVYYIRCFQSRMDQQGVTSITTQTSSKNVESVYDAVRTVITNPDKYITKQRLETIRESYLIKLKKDKINRFSNVNHWILPKGWSVKDIVEKVNINKIREVYEKYFNFDDFYLSNDKTEFK
jgi:predicted Zn-dependent peptidase